MDSAVRSDSRYPPEITKLEARIAREEESSSTVDMLSTSLQKTKTIPQKSTKKYVRNLVVENKYLRQKIVFYKKFWKTMMIFHNKTLQSFNLLQAAFKELSNKMIKAKEFMWNYWRFDVNKMKKNDLVVL